MRKKLSIDSLSLTSFETASAVAGTSIPTADTEKAECWSPLCGPTFWKTCDPATTA